MKNNINKTILVAIILCLVAFPTSAVEDRLNLWPKPPQKWPKPSDLNRKMFSFTGFNKNHLNFNFDDIKIWRCVSNNGSGPAVSISYPGQPSITYPNPPTVPTPTPKPPSVPAPKRPSVPAPKPPSVPAPKPPSTPAPKPPSAPTPKPPSVPTPTPKPPSVPTPTPKPPSAPTPKPPSVPAPKPPSVPTLTPKPPSVPAPKPPSVPTPTPKPPSVPAPKQPSVPTPKPPVKPTPTPSPVQAGGQFPYVSPLVHYRGCMMHLGASAMCKRQIEVSYHTGWFNVSPACCHLIVNMKRECDDVIFWFKDPYFLPLVRCTCHVHI